MSYAEKFRSENQQTLPTLADQEDQLYFCECSSCKTGIRYRNWPPRWLFAGFLLPILWLGNLSIYIYTQWHLDNEPTHAQIPLEDMPTVYELRSKFENTHLKIGKNTLEEIHRVNDSNTTLADPEDSLDCSHHYLRDHRTKFLKQVAITILDSHESERAYYRKWTLWTLLAIIAYPTTIALLVMAYRPR